ncbi:PEGA domain-containing protein [Archangium violaceum]|uniref:PEGA domain-containing protein n=1 Tax=Archangium violaceum TaxID=83451 RepID=UPI0036D8DE2A
MRKTSPGLGIVVTVLALWTNVAAAQIQQLQQPGRWTQGVSQEEQKTARELFYAGNAALTASIFVAANEKYVKALRHWNHPAIHYNLALALMKLDQPIEVYEHLTSAMHYGPEPLGQDKFENAARYKELLDTQLVRLTISCDEPGARVTLDGQVLFEGPGKYQGLVRPGTHSIVAVKEGYMTSDKSRALMPGEKATVNLRPYLIEYTRRWPAWMPWAVMGSGVAMAAGGGLLHQQTSKDYGVFDTGILQCGGCNPKPGGLADARARGDNLQRAAFASYGLGGAALITGAVLLYLNQPQPNATDPSLKEERVNLMPLLGGTNGVLATFRF